MQTVADPSVLSVHQQGDEPLHPGAHEALLCDPAADEDVILVKYDLQTIPAAFQSQETTDPSAPTRQSCASTAPISLAWAVT